MIFILLLISVLSCSEDNSSNKRIFDKADNSEARVITKEDVTNSISGVLYRPSHNFIERDVAESIDKHLSEEEINNLFIRSLKEGNFPLFECLLKYTKVDPNLTFDYDFIELFYLFDDFNREDNIKKIKVSPYSYIFLENLSDFFIEKLENLGVDLNWGILSGKAARNASDYFDQANDFIYDIIDSKDEDVTFTTKIAHHIQSIIETFDFKDSFEEDDKYPLIKEIVLRMFYEDSKNENRLNLAKLEKLFKNYPSKYLFSNVYSNSNLLRDLIHSIGDLITPEYLVTLSDYIISMKDNIKKEDFERMKSGFRTARNAEKSFDFFIDQMKRMEHQFNDEENSIINEAKEALKG